MSKMRNIAAILGRTEAANIDNSPGVDLDDNIADSSVVSSINYLFLVSNPIDFNCNCTR